MGRPPTMINNNNNNNTRCRFLPEEVAEMERLLVQNNGLTPTRTVLESLAGKFSQGRIGQAPVRSKQIWNWFQNRRYKLAKLDKADGASSSGRTLINCTAEQLLAQRASGLQFEVISGKDGAWYDIRCFLGHKLTEAGDPEILVRYSGMGGDEEEWVERKSIRRRSLPCEGFECLAVHPGDSVLCFQEGDEHALYYDAQVLDVQRKKHDARGCRCRFWIRYDHDQFEEVVPLRKVCRRPETDSRLKHYFSNEEEKMQLQQRKRQKKRMREDHREQSFSGDSSAGGGLSIDLNEDPPEEMSCFMESDHDMESATFLQAEA